MDLHSVCFHLYSVREQNIRWYPELFSDGWGRQNVPFRVALWLRKKQHVHSLTPWASGFTLRITFCLSQPHTNVGSKFRTRPGLRIRHKSGVGKA